MAPAARARYSPALRDFLGRLDAAGLTPAVRAGRAADAEQMSALAGMGLVSSASIRPGEDVWRLRFTKTGCALRALVRAEAARA